MTDAELATWWKLCDKATPEADWSAGFDVRQLEDGSWIRYATGPEHVCTDPQGQAYHHARADADFIRAARSVLPRLLDEVTRLRAADVGQLTAEKARLRKALAEIRDLLGEMPESLWSAEGQEFDTLKPYLIANRPLQG
jgi:hypothetical protein